MFTVWLLPVVSVPLYRSNIGELTWRIQVTFIVASSTGNILAAPLAQHSVSHALLTIAVSGFIVSIGLSLSLIILTIYFFRLIVHGYPAGATIISSFLPLGPLGQAGFSILLLGDNLNTLLPLASGQSGVLNAPATGEIVRVVCLMAAFVLWSFATMWMIFALLGIQEVVRKSRFPFAVPFWGLIFPNGKYNRRFFPLVKCHSYDSLGVYATLTLKLAATLNSPFFRGYGAMYSIATLLLWIWVTARTAMLLRNRRIFEAPQCMEDVDSPPLESKA